MLTWWVLWRVPVFLFVVMAAWWFAVRPILAEQGWVPVSDSFGLCGEGTSSADGCVIDGDTVIIGFGAERRRIRLTGFDAPELDGGCENERQLARSAKAALHDWLNRGNFEWNGAADPPRDQHGRELRSARRVASDGSRELLANTMIERGLAAESGWGAEPKDWCS